MTIQSALAPHELLELHELLQSEVVALKRLQADLDNVRDNQLKELLQATADAKTGRITALYQFVNGLQPAGQNQAASAGPGQGKQILQ